MSGVASLPALAACLVALGATASGAQEASAPTLAGSDTSETSTKAKGLPWIARTSAEAFYLQSPATSSGSGPYQISTYQGFTIQSLSFHSFHAGWRYRETLVDGLSQPYREVFALKLLGTAEVFRDLLFVSLGGSIPLVNNRMDPADSNGTYRAFSEYNPLPAPNFVTPQGLQLGVFGRYRVAAWDLMAGVAYSQPTLFEPVKGYPHNPASLLSGSVRAVLETSHSRHRLDAKTSRYGEEETENGTPAHKEGPMVQLRYAWLRASGRTAWQLGAGMLAKAFDYNRPLRLRTDLEQAEGNDNLQRLYAEAAWTWIPGPKTLWRAWLLPKALLEGATRESGHETELGLAMGMRVWEVHRLRVAGSLLYGGFKDRTYLGYGLKAEFAFRHLGFQDLEAQAETGEGN